MVLTLSECILKILKHAPGISTKTVVGLGAYPKMADDPAQNFYDHLTAQIRLLGKDSTFHTILGIAIYKPVYLSAEDQKKIDGEIKKYFSR